MTDFATTFAPDDDRRRRRPRFTTTTADRPPRRWPDRRDRPRLHRHHRRPGVGVGEADDQRPRRRQPAAAAEVPLGLGEVPGRLQQPVDADRGVDAGRHRAVEVAERAHRRRAADAQAQPGLLRHRRVAGRQQHRARGVPAADQPGVPPVPAAAGLRGGRAHAHLPVHLRVARPGRGRAVQHVPRGPVDHREGRLGAELHPAPARTRSSAPAPSRTTARSCGTSSPST